MGETFQLYSSNSAEIEEDAILFKWPMRSMKIEVNSIQGYYVYPFITNQNTLIIAYDVGNKTKRLKLVLDSSTTAPFIEKLQEIAPASANLLDREKDEALQILGTTDQTKSIFFIVLGIIVPAIIIGIHFPTLWHGFFDSERAQTTIEDIYAGNHPDSAYVSFKATLGDKGMVVTSFNQITRIVSNYRIKTTVAYYPLVPEDWQRGDPIKAVLLVDQKHMNAIAARKGERFEVSGVIRNILWEGLSYSTADKLSRQEQSPVENPILVDCLANPKKELFDASWIMAIVMVISVALGIRLLVNKKGG